MQEGEGMDMNARKQPPMPKVDESLVDSRIEQLWEFKEPDGTKVPVWCKGTVVGIKAGSVVHIKWDADYLREGDPEVSEEKLLIEKWNKCVETAWRMVLNDD